MLQLLFLLLACYILAFWMALHSMSRFLTNKLQASVILVGSYNMECQRSEGHFPLCFYWYNFLFYCYMRFTLLQLHVPRWNVFFWIYLTLLLFHFEYPAFHRQPIYMQQNQISMKPADCNLIYQQEQWLFCSLVWASWSSRILQILLNLTMARTNQWSQSQTESNKSLTNWVVT